MAENGQDGHYIDRIRLLQRIGQGSMGVVYRGFHEELHHEVAVKLLTHRQDGTQKRLVARFKREGKAASTIRHPNVVRFYGSGLYRERPYIVMEFIDGASLGDVLDEKGHLNPAHVVPMAISIAEGLAAIHRAGVIHRDIKPDNILLGTGGLVKITDLGLARYVNDPELNRLTATGVVVGTPLYVAPEAIKDTRTAGPKADIYSLGATLYHMITGRPPFDGSSPYDLMRMHLDKPVQPISDRITGVPRYVEEAVMACLTKDPAERPSAARLVRLLRGEHGIRDGVSLVRKLVLGAVAAVLALAVGTWVVIAPGSRPRARLCVTNPHPSMTLRVDDRAPVRAAAGQPLELSLPPGRHRLRIEMYKPNGHLLRWEGPVELDAGRRTPVTPTLQPLPLEPEPRLEDIPGEGMILRQGRVVGLEPPVSFSFAGRYHLARWDGRLATNAVVTVDREGTHLQDGWRRDREDPRLPKPRSYFVGFGREGPLPPYHLVSWQEIAYAAEAEGADDLRRVAGEQEDPCTPAAGLGVAAVSGWERWRQPRGARLPDRGEAALLSAHLRAGVWFREPKGLDALDGARYDRVLLVALPGDDP